MSEITDDMLDGLRCQLCGHWLEDVLAVRQGQTIEVPGYPRTCRACAAEAISEQFRRARPKR